jgi:hypothetical protein
MSESVSTDQIEREIEVERVALARALGDLQRQVAPDAIVEKISAALRENGGDLAGTAIRQAKANPLALAVTGAGLAWLVAGPSKTAARPATVAKSNVGYDDRELPTAHGFRQQPSDESFEARVARAAGETYDPTIRPTKGTDTIDKTRHDRSAASLRDRLMEGTEMMTETARDRVIAAREAAILAEQRIEARAREYGAAGKDAFASQPLMGALVAFGVGALAGALLPRTRVEDRHLGGARDRAFLEAERVYRAEAARLRAEAEIVAEEAVAAAGNALKGKDQTISPSADVPRDEKGRAFN